MTDFMISCGFRGRLYDSLENRMSFLLHGFFALLPLHFSLRPRLAPLRPLCLLLKEPPAKTGTFRDSGAASTAAAARHRGRRRSSNPSFPFATVRTTARPVLFGRGMFTTSRPPRAVHRRRGISLAFHRTDGRAGSARPADPSTAIATSSTHSSRTLSSDLLDRRETRARPGRRVRPVRSGRRVQPDPTDRRVMASRFAARGTRTRPIARTTS
jgi:hypothetical protein